MKVPENLHVYFWDVDAKELETETNGRFIAERILEKGNDEAVKWLEAIYPRTELETIVRESRRLSDKSRNYWGLLFQLWSTSNPSLPTRSAIWQR